MEKETYLPRQEAEYLLHLIRCALYKKIPEKKPVDCSWESLWNLARRNNVENTISPAIQLYPYEIPEEIAVQWKRAIHITLNRILQFAVERERIIEQMEKRGISCMPLKGCLMTEYYSVPGMRWMCDNDILYGYTQLNETTGIWEFRGDTQEEQEKWKKKASRELQQIMTEQGYTTEHLGGCHDVYLKKPFFNFEMHQKLVPEQDVRTIYYENPWKNARLIGENRLEFRFTDEAEYMFHLVHGNKHFTGGGCGIRTLIDEYVFLQKKTSLDWNRIQKELEKTGLTVFEKQLREASLHAFSEHGVLEEKDWDMISYMLGSGTYGTLNNKIKNYLKRFEESVLKNQRKVRWQYAKARFLPEESFIREYYPFFYRHKGMRILLPWYRILKGLYIHPKKLFAEWKILNQKIDEKQRRQKNEN